MRIFNSSSHLVASSEVISDRRAQMSSGDRDTGKLCLRLFGKTCVYMGTLAGLALAAVVVIWAVISLLN